MFGKGLSGAQPQITQKVYFSSNHPCATRSCEHLLRVLYTHSRFSEAIRTRGVIFILSPVCPAFFATMACKIYSTFFHNLYTHYQYINLLVEENHGAKFPMLASAPIREVIGLKIKIKICFCRLRIQYCRHALRFSYALHR